jgi:hypothetical protein
MSRPTNTALMKLRRRAEAGGDEEMLVQTFVDVGPLFTLLKSDDHQILYGRRGTGKTHALAYLRARVEDAGDVAALVDLRTIGSTGGIYSDPTLPVSERGTRLLMDVLGQVHDALTDFTLRLAENGDNVTEALSLLDRFGEAITEVRVVGDVESSAREATETESSRRARAGVKLDAGGPRAGVEVGGSDRETSQNERAQVIRGTPRHRVHFGNVSRVLGSLVQALPVDRIWIVLDEWVAVPMDLQPLLADLLRRAAFPVPGVIVKIAAIEQRSRFKQEGDDGDYVGIEVGADAAADLDLDDFMVFGDDPDAAKTFFRELLYRHVRAEMLEDELEPPADARLFQRDAFTQRNAFDELVRAAEGVPRDAINIVRMAGQRAMDDAISVEHVRAAARRWYTTDKEKAVQANPDATSLLHWIIDTVIGERRARAFLLEQGVMASHALITDLYDARVLHVIKRSVSSRDRPGVRYDVYALDFGCYVELVTTTKAPQGLFEVNGDGDGDGDGDEGEWVEVPVDDYRSIRRAVLDLDAFDSRQMALR